MWVSESSFKIIQQLCTFLEYCTTTNRSASQFKLTFSKANKYLSVKGEKVKTYSQKMDKVSEREISSSIFHLE